MAGAGGGDSTPAERSESGRRRSRLIVRLADFLAARSVLVSAVCCVAGIVALLLLPALAKIARVDENALMPGSADPVFSSQDAMNANKFSKDVGNILEKGGSQTEVRKYIRQRLEGIGAEVYYHKFLADHKHFHLQNFFTLAPNYLSKQTNSTCEDNGINTVGIIRSPRGDGKEAIVLVTPYNSLHIQPNEVLSLGLAFSSISLFARSNWLAKDIVWVAADSQYGEYTAVSAWLNDYFNPTFLSVPRDLDVHMCPIDEGASHIAFRRAGTVAAALVFKAVENTDKFDQDSIKLYAEASNGQVPNLDLINVVNYLAAYRQGFHVNIETFDNLLGLSWVKFIGELFQSLGRVAKLIYPQAKFDVTVSEYVEGVAGFANSILNQAIGVPTGSHGSFRDYQIDAVSLEISPRYNLRNENAKSAFIMRSGRLVEGFVRSINNLLERFHHSVFLYLLTAPNKFVSVGVYMIPFALLIAPLPIVAAALFNSSAKQTPAAANPETDSKVKTKLTQIDGTDITTYSWTWLPAAKVMFMVQVWAVIVSLLPYYISDIPVSTSTNKMMIWTLLSAASLVTIYSIFGSPYSSNVEWKLLKASMVVAASIGLGLMSIINFATAQIGALLLVPMCLITRPFKAPIEASLLVRASQLIASIFFVVLGFPPALLMIATWISKGFGEVSIGEFWERMEFLWQWNSATYLYVTAVHLPCWFLSIHLMMHPCRSVDSR